MRVTVCELPHAPHALQRAWDDLCAHVSSKRSELLVLPEFAFVEPVWTGERRDAAVWADIVARSQAWTGRLGVLGVQAVIGAGPVSDGARQYNEAFLWTPSGVTPLRVKAHLPEESSAWEARWFDRGRADFPAFRHGGLVFGVNICTELWDLSTYARYAAEGVHAIVSPRATAAATMSKWLAVGTVAAVRSGAFSLSSNRVDDGSCGGVGWIIGPDGECLARTSAAEPACTVDIDLEHAVRAKGTYPRSVFAR